MNSHLLRASFIGTVGLLLTACAINPTDLREPATFTCFVLKEPLVSRDKYGPFNVEWEVKLAAGPYVSERVDQDGTYFRAPPGGIYQVPLGLEDNPAKVSRYQVMDGGVYLPYKKNEPVHLYKYVSFENAPVVAQPANVDCRTAVFVKNPATAQLVVTVPDASAAATEIGMRAALQPNGQSFAGAAAGGAIGGALVSALAKNEIGKIVEGHPVKDPKFLQVLRDLGDQAVPIKPVDSAHPSGG